MAMTVQHQLGALATENGAQRTAVGQPLAPFFIIHTGRVMQQYQAEQTLFTRHAQQLRQTFTLRRTERPGCQKGGSSHGAR